MSTNQHISESDNLSVISRFFSPALIKELAKSGQSPLFARLALQSSMYQFAPQDSPMKELFEQAFKLLKQKNHRHEYVYKNALMHKILLGRHSLNTATMLTEFRTAQCKADVVILNGTSSVYEIKSERDSLSRLQQQIQSYRKVFAKVNVIAGENHSKSILESTPAEVGVLLLNDRFQISTLRESIECKKHLCSESIFKSIQISEAKKILERNEINIPDVPNTLIYRELLACFRNLCASKVHDEMVSVLRASRSKKSLSNFLEKLPPSVQAAALTQKLKRAEYLNLITAMDVPLKEAIQWN